MRFSVNTQWMLLEQLVRTATAFFVGIYVARYLGLTQFGVLNYCMSIVVIITTLSRFGMDSILTREISRTPHDLEKLRSSAALMMFAAALVFSAACLLILYFSGAERTTLAYVSILLFMPVLQCLYVVDYQFQAQQHAKITSMIKAGGLLIGALVRIILVEYDSGLFWIIAVSPLEYLLIGAAFALLNRNYVKQPIFRGASLEYITSLARSAWPMLLASLSTILYLRTDQLMIQHMLGPQELGLYSAASKIYEGWVVIPFILSAAALPRLVKQRQVSIAAYERELCFLFSVVFWSGITVALICSIFSEFIIRTSFGSAYLPSANVLGISMWAAAFSGLGSVSVRYFVTEGLERLNLWRTVFALALNVVLNWILIPIAGIEGAAISTLISLVSANFLLDFLDSRLRRLALIKCKAIALNSLWNQEQKN